MNKAKEEFEDALKDNVQLRQLKVLSESLFNSSNSMVQELTLTAKQIERNERKFNEGSR